MKITKRQLIQIINEELKGISPGRTRSGGWSPGVQKLQHHYDSPEFRESLTSNIYNLLKSGLSQHAPELESSDFADASESFYQVMNSAANEALERVGRELPGEYTKHRGQKQPDLYSRTSLRNQAPPPVFFESFDRELSTLGMKITTLITDKSMSKGSKKGFEEILDAIQSLNKRINNLEKKGSDTVKAINKKVVGRVRDNT